MTRHQTYAHYSHHGIAEAKQHDAPDGVWWIAQCRCGWQSLWRFTTEESADEDAAEHMRLVADEP